MRIEKQGDYNIICGCILPIDCIKPNQQWIGTGNSPVTVSKVEGGDVYYTWYEKGELKIHHKESFSFQCRYCLIVDLDNLPSFLGDYRASQLSYN